jgi:hypothetical protein
VSEIVFVKDCYILECDVGWSDRSSSKFYKNVNLPSSGSGNIVSIKQDQQRFTGTYCNPNEASLYRLPFMVKGKKACSPPTQSDFCWDRHEHWKLFGLFREPSSQCWNQIYPGLGLLESVGSNHTGTKVYIFTRPPPTLKHLPHCFTSASKPAAWKYFDCCLSHFRTSVSTSSSSAKRLAPSC